MNGNILQANDIMETSKAPGMEIAKTSNIDRAEPRDTHKIAYIIHFFLGAGNLLPWNTFITAIDYFGYLYPHRHVEKVFSVAYMSSSMMALIMMLTWGNFGNKNSFRFRMNLGFTLFVFSILVAPILDWAQHGNTRFEGTGLDCSYYLTVASVVTCGLADGIVAGTLVGSAGKLPKEYMQAIFAGNASSGVLATILRIMTKATLEQSERGLRISAHFYFLVSEVILTASIVCCNLLYKLPVMQKYNNILQEDPLYCRPKRFWQVARTIRWPAFGVLMIYIVTLSIFPGYIAESVESKSLKDWYPILLIAIYNASDLLGKSLTTVFLLKGTGKATWGSLARLMFYPLFKECLHGPKWLKTELPMGLLTAFLGLSNGYLTSCLMILAPKEVLSAEAEIAAIVMVVFLGAGLVGGSVLGWFWLI